MSWDRFTTFLGNAEQHLGRQLGFLIRWIALLWLIELIDFGVKGHLELYGIRPRSLAGLIGIPLAPFLHGTWEHLASNTLSLVPLGWVMLMTGMRRFWITSLVVTLVAGLGVWIFGQPNQVHIGASGLIFGYLGFLLLWGFVQRSILWFAVAILVGAVYGSMVWNGIGFGEAQISWEGHLFGFLSGILAAWLQRKKGVVRTVRAVDV